MTREEIFDKVKTIIKDKLNIADDNTIKLESSFRTDLKADSLDSYEIIYAIEEEFGIQISDEKVNLIEKVSDVIDYIEQSTSK